MGLRSADVHDMNSGALSGLEAVASGATLKYQASVRVAKLGQDAARAQGEAMVGMVAEAAKVGKEVQAGGNPAPGLSRTGGVDTFG